MEALSCQVCFARFNMAERLPKVLQCGHTFCMSCVTKWNQQQGRLQCPTCQDMTYDADLSKIPDNQPIKDILISQEVRCPHHSSEIVIQFCLTHMSVICPQCAHESQDCEAKDLAEDMQEITNAILQLFERLFRELSSTTMSQYIKQSFDKRFKAAIGENIKLLETFKELKRKSEQLQCVGCQGVADNYLELVTFSAFCMNCATYSPDISANTVRLSEKSNQEISTEIASRVEKVLREVNFCDLTVELLNSLERRNTLSCRDFLQLGKDLLKLEKARVSFPALPESFLCPGCKGVQRKNSCMMYVLPCRKLHALCGNCLPPGALDVICPLDKLTFRKKPEELEKLTSPAMQGGSQSVVRPSTGVNMPPELQAMRNLSLGRPGPPQFNPSQPRPYMPSGVPGQPPWLGPSSGTSAQFGPPKFGMPPQFVMPAGGAAQFGMPPGGAHLGPRYGPPLIPGLSEVMNRSNIPPANPVRHSGPLEGIPVPIPPLSPGQNYLLRFPSVLPNSRLPVSGNNKGWFVNFTRNQVDAVTMISSEGCQLESIGLANPLDPTKRAVVESVTLFMGKAAFGSQLGLHMGGEQLIGGDELVTYVKLGSPFRVPPSTYVTLKVKIVTQMMDPQVSGFELYRGNPFDRPDVWFGSDSNLWEFEETTRVAVGEMENGQNNLSGPILVFIYRR